MLASNPAIAKDTLRVLAKHQGKTHDPAREEEPGKILHEWQGPATSPWPFPYFGSADATFLFLILASLYYEATGDRDTINSLKDSILAAVGWAQATAHQDKNQLARYQPMNPRGIRYQGWRDTLDQLQAVDPQPPLALVEIQGYKYAAYQRLPNILALWGETKLAARLQRAGGRLRQAFLDRFWWPQEEYCFYLIDGRGQAVRIITSNPGHLLFTGILPPDKIQAVVRRLFAADMRTPYGIRTEATTSPSFDPAKYQQGSIWPHDNWIIAQGLKLNGFTDEYRKIRQGLRRAYEELGGMPEFYAVNTQDRLWVPQESNQIQGWAAGALLNLITEMVD